MQITQTCFFWCLQVCLQKEQYSVVKASVILFFIWYIEGTPNAGRQHYAQIWFLRQTREQLLVERSGFTIFNVRFCIFPALRWQNDTCSVVSSYEMPTTTLADPAL